MSIKPKLRDQVDRPLPASPDSEKAILCSVLLDPSCLDKLDGIKPTSFHHPSHRAIFATMQGMRKAGKQIDLVTITQEISDHGKLADIGGPAYLAELSTFIPTAANVASYAEIVAEKALEREKIRLGTSLQDAAFEGRPTDEIQKAIASLDQNPAKESTSLTFRKISEIIAMKFSDDDLYLANGYLVRGGSLAIVGSGGIGKSRLVMQMAICSASGIPFLDIPTRGQPKWMFLQTENGNRRLQHDLQRMTQTLDAEAISLLDDRIVLHTLENSNDVFMRPTSESVADRLIESIIHHDPDIVVVDVLRDFGIGDLNTDEGMTGTLEAITRIVRSGRSDRTIIIIHHARTGKAAAAGAFGMERSNFGRNSKVLLGWARAVINIAPLSEDDPDLLGLGSGKNNDHREMPPLAMRLLPDHMLYRVDRSVDVGSKIAALNETGRKGSQFTIDAVTDVVDALKPSVPDKKTIVAKLIEKGLGKSKAYDLVASAESAGRIKFSSKNGGFVSTHGK